MYVCHNHKFGFVHIRKTGGQAIKTNLLNHFNTIRVGGKHEGIKNVPDLDGYFLFTMVRNPYKRIASQYRFRILRDRESDQGLKPFWVRFPTPYDWVETNEWLSQSELIDNRFKIYHFENYKYAVRDIGKKLGLEIDYLKRDPYTHYYGDYDWRNWIDNESILFINEHCKDDFEFGYEMLSGIPSGPGN